MSKISFHTKKLATQLELNEFNSQNVKTIAENMKLAYPEYKRMPVAMLSNQVSEAFKSWCQNDSSSSCKDVDQHGDGNDSDRKKRKRTNRSNSNSSNRAADGDNDGGVRWVNSSM